MSYVSEISSQSFTAVKWSVLGTAVRYGLQISAQIVLARLLGPENYGLFAMGLVVLTFSNFFAHLGLAWGLVQSRDLSKDDVRFVFTWQVISGILVALGLYTLAPAVASYFNEGRLESIVRWLSLACLINAAAAPATNLLRRDLDFRALNIIEVVSYSIGYVAIGIPLAYNGAGVWALVAAWLSQALCSLVLLVIRHPHPVRPLFWHAGATALSSVGITVFATNICNWLLNNLDRVLLARFLNAQAVGLYVVGYNLATTPNSLLVGAVQPVFLAAGARVQSEPERLRRVYLSVLATIWVLITPMFVLIAIVAQHLVNLLYGPAWASTGVVLAIVALAMPAYMTWGMSTPILWNTGGKHLESLLQLPILAIAAVAFYQLASGGIIVVALVLAGVLFARAIVITTAACRRLGIVLGDVLPFAARGAMTTLLAAAGAFVGLKLGYIPGPEATILAGGLLGGCSIVTAVALVFPALLGQTVLEMLGHFSLALSAALGGPVRASAGKR